MVQGFVYLYRFAKYKLRVLIVINYFKGHKCLCLAYIIVGCV